MRKLWTLTIGTGLVALMATAAWSLTVEIRLTPTMLSADHRSFTVTTKDVGEFKEFDVTVTQEPGGRELSPFLWGDLSLDTPNEHIARVRLEPKREGNRVSFWFRVSPQAILGSRFQIGDQAYGISQDEHGQPKMQPQIGASVYWFLLRDFAGTQAGRQ